MAIPADVMRLSIVGHGAGPDIWNISFWWKPSLPGDHVASTNAQAAASLTAILGDAKWTTFKTFLMTLMPSACTLDSVSLYCYPTGGPNATAIANTLTPAVGTNGVGPQIPQTCQVASLRTGQSGRSFRGRVYLPKWSATLTGALQFAGTDCTTTANAVAAFLSGWSLKTITPAGQGIFAVVVSPTRGAASGIEKVVVDSKPDVQRRRINRMTTGAVSNAAVTP
jgi:hypothetical protein